MRGVLRAGEARFDQRKSGLHEHHQVTGEQHPDEIDGNFIFADLGTQFREGGLPRGFRCNIRDSSCRGTGGIARPSQSNTDQAHQDVR